MAVTAFLNAARRHDVARLEVLGHHLPRCGRPPRRRARHIGSLFARTGVDPGSAMPSASQARCMVFAVPIPAQTPGRQHRAAAHLGQLVDAEPPAGDVPGREEHVLDVAVPAPVGAAGLVAAGDDDRRDVQPGGGHELAGRGLVAGGQADHAVQLRALHLHLDVVGDQVAGGQDVAAAVPGAVDEVARGRGAHLEADAAGRLDRPLGPAGDLVQVAEADRELRGRVHDGDLRLDACPRRTGRAPATAPGGSPTGRCPARSWSAASLLGDLHC